jgi:hypothetical protein
VSSYSNFPNFLNILRRSPLYLLIVRVDRDSNFFFFIFNIYETLFVRLCHFQILFFGFGIKEYRTMNSIYLISRFEPVLRPFSSSHAPVSRFESSSLDGVVLLGVFSSSPPGGACSWELLAVREKLVLRVSELS